MYYIAFPGDSSSISNFGGTPYFITHALNLAGKPAAGLNLPRDKVIQFGRYVWNFWQLALGRGRGGFQYSDFFLNRIWKSAPEMTSDDVIVSIFQIMGKRPLRSKAKKVFYFDMTLNQLFSEYNTLQSSYARRRALAIEKRGYMKADLIICKSEWAAKDVREHYGIPADKVKVVVPGANVSDEAEQYLMSQTPCPIERRVKFLFIGKEPERKGLFRFLDAMALLPHLRDRVVLETIGTDEDSIPAKYDNVCEIYNHGFIDKKRDMEAFCDIILNSHIGILLSTAEAGGLSLREFQLAGLPVLAPRVGGSPEWVTPGAGVLVDKDETPAAIAAKIETLLTDRDALESLRQVAQNARSSMLWGSAARKMIDFIENAPRQNS